MTTTKRAWGDSTNKKRPNGKDGSLMAPTIDHLIDRGFIGFEESGLLVISPVAHLPSLERMGIETHGTVNVGGFTEGQRQYPGFHRDSVLLRAVRYSGLVVKPKLIAHCDWSTSATKRWVAVARLSASGCYEVVQPVPAGRTDTLFARLRADMPAGPILAGFDFPIGVPRAYAAAVGFGRFTEMLLRLGMGELGDFYNPAGSAEEISLARPFFPRVPGGTNKQQLLSGLGFHNPNELLRECDRKTPVRGNACAIFWTLGANQVGKAAIQGWRDLLAPAVRDRSISIWPFDGEMDALLESSGITVAECYPGETYGHLGLTRNFGKSQREGRSGQARAVLSWCERNAVELQVSLATKVEQGFGVAATGEDAFDAFIGLLGMIEVVQDPSRFAAPTEPAVRNIEGWILGMDTESVMPASGAPPHITRNPPLDELQRKTPATNTAVDEGRGRVCPACHQKVFARWPWGWDAHAAHACTGIEGKTAEERKQAYRERYLA